MSIYSVEDDITLVAFSFHARSRNYKIMIPSAPIKQLETSRALERKYENSRKEPELTTTENF